MNNKKNIQGLIYIRTSQESQRPENQIDYIIKTFKLDIERCEIHKEIESAWKKDTIRPILELVLKKARRSKTTVFLWDYDRLYRNRKKVVSTVKSYASLGVPIRSARQIWLDSILQSPEPWNEIMFDLALNIVGWIGEEESQKKSERVKAAYSRYKYEVKKNNATPWGRAPCDIDMAKLKQLKGAGLSLRKIARHLSCSPNTVRKYHMCNNGSFDEQDK